MQVKAKLNYLRIAPRKVRLVADLIRKKRVETAQAILKFTIKKGAGPLLKLLNSAVANARNNFQIEPDNLYIYKITVDEGPKYKRWMPRARGQASEIQKKTSHIIIILDEIEKKLKKAKKIHPVKSHSPRKIVPKAILQGQAGISPKAKLFNGVKKPEEKIREEIIRPKEERPKLKPKKEKTRPKIIRGIKRIFQRKAF